MSDINMYNEVFIHNLYDFSAFKDFEPKIIIDGGCNIGDSCTFFHKRFNNVKIIGIEPEKENYLLAKENNDKYKNIILLQKGLWKKNINLAIKDKSTDFCAYEILESNDGDIEGITIGKIIKDYKIDKIDILKLDIEGSEKFIFETGAFENWLGKVRFLVIELHDRISPGCSDMFFKAISKYKIKTSEVLGWNILIEFDI